MNFLKKHALFCSKQFLYFLPVLIIAAYPIAAIAGDVTQLAMNEWNLEAPFLWSWMGVWLFAIAGGFSSLFIIIEDVDKNIRFIFIAKPFMGTFSSVAVCMFMVSDSNIPSPSLVFYSYFVALCCSPIIQSLLVYLHSEEGKDRILTLFKLKKEIKK